MTSCAPFTIELTGVPDRDELVVEIWCGDQLFAELRHDGADVAVQLYCPSSPRTWDIRLADLLDVLHKARDRLGPVHPRSHDGDDSAP